MATRNIPLDLWDPYLIVEDHFDANLQSDMLPYVDRRYTEEEIWGFYVNFADIDREDSSLLRTLAKRIRAFDVPNLSGITFLVHNFNDILSSLENILKQKIPTIEWSDLDVDEEIIMKYRLLHVITPAPVDEATSQPMVLEIFGKVTGQEPNLIIELINSTYANTEIPGIGVPFYL